VPPVSTTMKCVINLTIQYFLLYTALAIARTYNEVSGTGPKVQQTIDVLSAGCTTVNYAPMLCVLFLGTRMRALQLSQGEPDKFDLPQPFVKNCMQACAWSVLVQTLMVLLIPVVLGGSPKVGADGTPEVPEGGAMAKAFTAVRYLSMIGMYGGFSTVCYGAVTMEAPAALWANGAPPVSPAVACTMNLCYQYFGIYLGIALLQTYHQFSKKTDFTETLAGAFQMGQNTVNFAPMLCILFIGARMRALQIDPVNGNPQKWAQQCFYLCAYSVLVQLALVIIVPVALGGKLNKGLTEGDVTFELANPTVYNIMTAVRYGALIALYGGFTTVIYSICVIKNPNGPTPAVSPAMQCVMNLTIQFFFVYFMLFLFVTIKQFTSGGDSLSTAIRALDSARATVQFCPMLSILFVGLRMRALQITEQKGAPQGWAQQCMFLSTYAVLFQLLMVLLLPLVGASTEIDSDGSPVAKGSGWGAKALVAFRYLAFLCLYGGAVGVVYAVFDITPENANGRGSLIPGVDVPVPPAVSA